MNIDRHTWARATVSVAALAVLAGTATLVSAAPVAAKSAVNVFTMKGSFNGTLTLNKKNCTILKGQGEGNSPNSYLISLDELKVALPGTGIKSADLNIDEPRGGTFHVAHIAPGSDKVASITDENSDAQFSETSGTLTIKGSKGSLNVVMEFEPSATLTSGAPTFSGSETLTGSWSCAPGAFNIQG